MCTLRPSLTVAERRFPSGRRVKQVERGVCDDAEGEMPREPPDVILPGIHLRRLRQSGGCGMRYARRTPANAIGAPIATDGMPTR